MNWGYKLTIVYIAFAVGILTLVFKARGEKVDLVAKDYYNQELAFGQRIEASRNAASLTSQVGVEVVDEVLVVTMPEECLSAAITGTLTLYCPSDAGSDVVTDLTSGVREQVISLSGKKHTAYIVKVNWEMSGKKYYYEKSVTI